MLRDSTQLRRRLIKPEILIENAQAEFIGTAWVRARTWKRNPLVQDIPPARPSAPFIPHSAPVSSLSLYTSPRSPLPLSPSRITPRPYGLYSTLKKTGKSSMTLTWAALSPHTSTRNTTWPPVIVLGGTHV